MVDSRPERTTLKLARTERPDLKPERPDLRPERPERPGLMPEKPYGGTNERTDG